MRVLCEIAEVSRSGYYRYLEMNQQPDKDIVLAAKVKNTQESFRYTYGAKRMAKHLTATGGVPINHKRIARIMNEHFLNAQIRKRRHPGYWYRQRSTQRLSDRQCSPNILNRQFTSPVPLKKLVTDSTCIFFSGGTLYLCAVMDLYNHEIVAHEISLYNTIKTTTAPILKLLATKKIEGCLLHCDRGPTYRSFEYQSLLKDNQITSSYSRAGNCWDNAMIESFFGHLKCELGYVNGRNKKQGFQQLAQEIRNYIQFYNEKRIQKNLGWVSPVEYRIKNSGMIECIKVST